MMEIRAKEEEIIGNGIKKKQYHEINKPQPLGSCIPWEEGRRTANINAFTACDWK